MTSFKLGPLMAFNWHPPFWATTYSIGRRLFVSIASSCRQNQANILWFPFPMCWYVMVCSVLLNHRDQWSGVPHPLPKNQSSMFAACRHAMQAIQQSSKSYRGRECKTIALGGHRCGQSISRIERIWTWFSVASCRIAPQRKKISNFFMIIISFLWAGTGEARVEHNWIWFLLISWCGIDPLIADNVGLSENRIYCHLIGIMIINHWV